LGKRFRHAVGYSGNLRLTGTLGELTGPF